MFQFRRFPSYAYLIQRTMLKYCLSGFPHSEIHGYSGYLLLPVAYRSLSRPSSAPDAKAFPLRSFQLDLSNHLLILKVELCRQFNRDFRNCNCYPILYDVPQLKLKIRSSVSFKQKTSLLPCLSLLHYIVQFSRFDLPTAFAARFEDLSYARSSNPTTNVTGMVGPSGLEPPTLRLSVVRSSQLSYGPVRRHKLRIPRRDCMQYALAHFAASPLRSQTRFAGLCSDSERLAIISLVEIVGIEPATSCLQGRRSPS